MFNITFMQSLVSVHSVVSEEIFKDGNVKFGKKSISVPITQSFVNESLNNFTPTRFWLNPTVFELFA